MAGDGGVDRATSGWRRLGLVAGAVAAVVALGLLVRVDVPSPVTLAPETAAPEPSPDPTPTPVADEWPAIGAWRTMADAPFAPRTRHVAAWTGACPEDAAPPACGELLVWGGHGPEGTRRDGGAYNPMTDEWRAIAEAPRAPPGHQHLRAVWTGVDPSLPQLAGPQMVPGGRLVLWGATRQDLETPDADELEPRGVAYDPEDDAWEALPEAPIAPRVGHSLTWTGAEVIVWGGQEVGTAATGRLLADGAAYDPATGAWRRIADAPLSGRHQHLAVWQPVTGRLLVWGGVGRDGGRSTPLLDGAQYDPATDAWQPVADVPALLTEPRRAWAPAGAPAPLDSAFVLISTHLLDPDTGQPALLAYHTSSDRWQLRATGPLGPRSGDYVEVGAGLIAFWGGGLSVGYADGAVHHPGTGEWRRAPADRQPNPGESATWTGQMLLIWGGGQQGAIWEPTALGRAGPPPP